MDNALENHDCPPKMADGRHFTDYRPSDYVHDLILKQNGIKNSFDLKKTLTNQALELQKINRDYYETRNGCGSCGSYYLPDPNGHVDYWNQYGQSIGYNNLMTLEQPSQMLAPIPTLKPASNECAPEIYPPQTFLPNSVNIRNQHDSNHGFVNVHKPNIHITIDDKNIENDRSLLDQQSIMQPRQVHEIQQNRMQPRQVHDIQQNGMQPQQVHDIQQNGMQPQQVQGINRHSNDLYYRSQPHVQYTSQRQYDKPMQPSIQYHYNSESQI